MSDVEEVVQEVQDVPVEVAMKKYVAPAPDKLDTNAILALINVTANAGEDLKKEAAGLTIAGIEDKEGYERVHKVQMKSRGLRVRIVDALKLARDPYNEAASKIKKVSDVFEVAFKAIEAPLASEKKKIDDAIAKAAAEKAAQERARVLGLQEQLRGFGCLKTFEEVAAMSDDEFNTLLVKVKADFEAEVEKQRIKDVEAENLRKENELLRSRVSAQPSAAVASEPFSGPSDYQRQISNPELVESNLIAVAELIAAIRKWSVENSKPVMENLTVSTIRMICKELGIPTEVRK